MGGVAKCWTSAWNVPSHSSIHSKFCFPFLIRSKKGMHLSVDLEMNLLKTVTFPSRLCTCFMVLRVSRFRIVQIFSGLASIPRALTMDPGNFQMRLWSDTSTEWDSFGIVGGRRTLFPSLWRNLWTVATSRTYCPRTPPWSSNLVSEHSIHEPLTGCLSVLKSGRHDFVAIEPHIDNEVYMFLVRQVHWYLIVTGIRFHER